MIIYKIVNNINGKIYIGQTIKDLNKRMAVHLCTSSYVGKVLRKYGLQSFTISVIDDAYNKETLNEKEIYWIKFYNSKIPNGYNITGGGEGHLGPHLETTKQKMRKPKPPRTEEHKRHMSESHIGLQAGGKHPLFGKKHTKESRKKMSDSLRGKIPWNKGLTKMTDGRVKKYGERESITKLSKGGKSGIIHKV